MYGKAARDDCTRVNGSCHYDATIVVSVIPSDEETNKALAVAKVLISTAVLLGAGVAVFAIAQRKKARALALIRP